MSSSAVALKWREANPRTIRCLSCAEGPLVSEEVAALNEMNWLLLAVRSAFDVVFFWVVVGRDLAR